MGGGSPVKSFTSPVASTALWASVVIVVAGAGACGAFNHLAAIEPLEDALGRPVAPRQRIVGMPAVVLGADEAPALLLGTHQRADGVERVLRPLVADPLRDALRTRAADTPTPEAAHAAMVETLRNAWKPAGAR